MIIQNDNDTCKICGAYFEDTGYCTNGHLKLTVENIKKYYKKIDEYHIKKSTYTIWSNNTHAVTIHEDDEDIVSVFSLKEMKYLYLDEKTRNGIEIMQKMGAFGG